MSFEHIWNIPYRFGIDFSSSQKVIFQQDSFSRIKEILSIRGVHTRVLPYLLAFYFEDSPLAIIDKNQICQVVLKFLGKGFPCLLEYQVTLQDMQT